MASQTPTNPPAIDLTNIVNLKPGTSAWLSTCNDVRDALEKHGCFLVVYDQVYSELNKEVYLAIEELFHLSTEKKLQYISEKPYLGYFGQYPQVPIFESMSIGDTTNMETVQDFINFMLPSANEHLCERLNCYTKQVAELQQIIMRMVFESYDLEKYYHSHKESTAYIFRANKYRVPQMNEKNVGLGAHTDLSFITILHQNQVQGLEIKTNDGNWIPVHFAPSSFVVLAGDALLAWSSGRIRSCFHRVTMTEKEPRYSIGLFSYRNGRVEAPNELVDDEHPLLFKPFEHFELLCFAFSEGSHLGENKLKAYCGI